MKQRIIDFILGVLEMAFGIWILKQPSQWVIGHILGITLCTLGVLAVFAALTITQKERDEYRRLR